MQKATLTPPIDTTEPPVNQPTQQGIYRIERAENLVQVQSFIRDCFARQHGAQVNVFAPQLLALINKQQIQATLGYRPASESLFLEQYLNAPVESELGLRTTSSITRQQILEISNLASISSNGTLRLIPPLCRHFIEMGFSWLVMTITPQVLAAFTRLGLASLMLPLSYASAERLHAGQHDWGSYYDHQPRVYAINFHQAYEGMQQKALLKKLLSRAEPVLSDHGLYLERRAEHG